MLSELKAATEKHGPFPSDRHGHSVIEEEFDEFWYEVKHGTRERAREEAIQLAAMSLRYLIDL